ncbi:hypothetical protein M5K25_022189 [Dendrobium thyrsiflorum]|uniref:Uncharacterized protein n=1 Tax=Dendrobium thyrsiflorum TaxID=117978 RepID=A0ABD0U5S4_DENTH
MKLITSDGKSKQFMAILICNFYRSLVDIGLEGTKVVSLIRWISETGIYRSPGGTSCLQAETLTTSHLKKSIANWRGNFEERWKRPYKILFTDPGEAENLDSFCFLLKQAENPKLLLLPPKASREP